MTSILVWNFIKQFWMPIHKAVKANNLEMFAAQDLLS